MNWPWRRVSGARIGSPVKIGLGLRVFRPLAAHLYAAAHGRDVVLLDLRSGDYELLAGLGGSITLSADGRRLAARDPAMDDALAALELFGESDSQMGRPIPALPTRTPLPGVKPTITLGDRLWVASGWVGMLRGYYGRSFQGLIAHAARPTQKLPERAERLVFERAAVFDRLSVWLPFQRDCLYRCCLLLHALGRHGDVVDWVFGVRTWPFAAHCWLQLGDQVLTDYPERLSMFSPIFAV